MSNLNVLLDKISRAKALDFGDIISESIELYKKVWVKGLVVVLFIMLVAVCLGFVFKLIGLAPDPNIFINGFDLETIFRFYSLNAIYSIPQTILISTVTLGLVAAFYRVCAKVISGESGQDDYFYFFQKEYFSKVFMLGIIYTAIAAVAQLLLLIPYLYVFVPLSYFAVILAFNPDLSEMDIVKASFALGNKKWLITLGTMFVAGLIAMLGILGCVIGIVLTLSIVYLPVFQIYKEAIGLHGDSEIDQIGVNDDSEI
jgi:hypothetical protein